MEGVRGKKDRTTHTNSGQRSISYYKELHLTRTMYFIIHINFLTRDINVLSNDPTYVISAERRGTSYTNTRWTENESV